MNQSEVFAKVAKVISEIFELKIEKINENTSNKNLSKWDSLQHIKLIVALEDEFDLEFEPEEIGVMTSVKSIIDNILNKD